MTLNVPGGGKPQIPRRTPSPHEGRTYVRPDTAGMDRRDIRDTLRDEAERAELHRQQARADAEEAKARDERTINLARWTLIVAVLTLAVSVAALLVTLVLSV